MISTLLTQGSGGLHEQILTINQFSQQLKSQTEDSIMKSPVTFSYNNDNLTRDYRYNERT